MLFVTDELVQRKAFPQIQISFAALKVIFKWEWDVMKGSYKDVPVVDKNCTDPRLQMPGKGLIFVQT